MMKSASLIFIAEKTSSSQLKLQPSSKSCISLSGGGCKLEILLLHKAVVAKTTGSKREDSGSSHVIG
jgi:hypothetical protein